MKSTTNDEIVFVVGVSLVQNNGLRDSLFGCLWHMLCHLHASQMAHGQG